MRPQNIAATACLLAGITAACTPRSALPPLPAPETPELPSATEPITRYLHFSPNIYRYHFEQTAQVNARGSTDTLPSTITTRAVILVTVAAEPDSSIGVSISFDSISMTTQGSIPSRGFSQVASLDSVLHARFSATGIVVEPRLPDSLCAYVQFLSTARDLLLPGLAVQIESPATKVYTDTVVQTACRGGTNIELNTIRELRDLRREPIEFALHQRTEIHGLGQLRRDSITISGSISTSGAAVFATNNRLPTLVQTQSEGTITVQLGSLTTKFNQISRQEIRLEKSGSP
jgi:hypothetical protein